MSVRNKIYYHNGIYFITFTCARWIPLFSITNGYQAVYNWFDYLTSQGHYIAGYVTMPDHVHAIIAFGNTDKSINSIVGNGKRFIAYYLVDLLEKQSNTEILNQLSILVNNTDRQNNKKHEVFEPSFDRKECRTIKFTQQKLHYIHLNPCKSEPRLAILPEDYLHSSAKYYYTNTQGIYPVTSYMDLQDIDLETIR
jgi:REP element-mobilizing transposase RayT